MNENKATARPWSLSKRSNRLIKSGKNNICTMMGYYDEAEERRANAELIVRAVNHHKKLIEALERVVEREYDLDPESRNYWDEELEDWKKLIKKAKGE